MFSAYEELFVSVENLARVRNVSGSFVGESEKIDPKSDEFTQIEWEDENLQLCSSEVTFGGNNQLPFEISSLRTPCDFFLYFVTDTFLTEITNQSNLYAKKQNPKSDFNINLIDLKKYIGILMFMSVYRYPNVRSYWSRYQFDAIMSTMTVNEFEAIRSKIHFADDSNIPSKDDPEYDVLHKIRPVINHFNDRFSSVPMLQHLSVDEQMCATKMKHSNIRQYMPNKPNKHGFKLFNLCDSGGFCYSFEVYTGKIFFASQSNICW